MAMNSNTSKKRAPFGGISRDSSNIQFFGYELRRNKRVEQERKERESFVNPENYDGAYNIEYGVGKSGFSGFFVSQDVDLDTSFKTEQQLIQKYRSIAKMSEVDSAIDDIINEAIVTGTNLPPVELNLDELENNDNIKISDSVRKMIIDEFNLLLKLLNFNSKGYEIFRRWYVDGKLYYHKIIDEQNPKNGIKELRPVDPLFLRKIREIRKERIGNTNLEVITGMEEYYLFLGEDGATNSNAARVSKDAISLVTSGLFDTERKIILGYLFKAIKPSNMLRMMEDAIVIYRIVRAPERRIFYIDVGDMPTTASEQYVQKLALTYKNKLVYDGVTGEVRDDRRFSSMMEDFWMPRRNGTGTQVETLPGGDNLGSIEDVLYFQKKLYKALNVPVSRLESDTGFSFGRASEITRDELKFSKFIDRLRTKFSELFLDILKTQLALKGIMDVHEFEEIKTKIFFDFQKDSHFTEMKNAEIFQERLNQLQQADPFVGKYLSSETIMKKILQMTDEEIKDERKKIDSEKKAGYIVTEDDKFNKEMEFNEKELDMNMLKDQEKEDGKKEKSPLSDDQSKQPPRPSPAKRRTKRKKKPAQKPENNSQSEKKKEE